MVKKRENTIVIPAPGLCVGDDLAVKASTHGHELLTLQNCRRITLLDEGHMAFKHREVLLYPQKHLIKLIQTMLGYKNDFCLPLSS